MVDDLVLAGFYFDDCVIPIDQAAEAYCEEVNVQLLLTATNNLLDLLPPAGCSYDRLLDLAYWLDELDADARNEFSIATDDVRLLAPVARPSKIILVAENYASRTAERGSPAAVPTATAPCVYLKPPSTTLNHPFGSIVLPRTAPDHVDVECALGVVIGRRCRNVSEQDALEHVAGYTIVIDVSNRNVDRTAGQPARDHDRFFGAMRGKWHDTFCPVGPCVLSADLVAVPQSFPLQLAVNGKLKQKASTAQMIIPVAAVLAFLSSFTTLEPGDIIATGTPGWVDEEAGSYLRAGDVVRAGIGGIGVLQNSVRAEA
jgi:2-keto-4-pentenoate hydratase/2-oxohepta-3-ene-1,7-dioic acid hydratase in catechol pathway